LAAGAGARRITESEVCDRPLHRVQGVQPAALQQPVAVDLFDLWNSTSPAG
jgi:hypothetical protein